MRVLVTGGSGFVGAAVVRALNERHPEYSIYNLDIHERNPVAKQDIHQLKVDVRRLEEVKRAFIKVKPDVVVHTAGVVPQGPIRYTRRNKDAVHQINVGGTKNILDASIATSVKALVYTSTCCVVTDDCSRDYPNYDETVPIPQNSLLYGETKAKAESLVLAGNSKELKTCALRPSVILGEDDYQLIPAIHRCIAKGETPFQIGDGDNLYDFTHVDNVADAHVLAIENLLSSQTAAGEAILISNGQPISFRDFCLAVWGAFGHKPPVTLRIPSKIAWGLGFAAECYTWLVGSEATPSRGSVNDAIGTRYANISKAKKLLGYEPRVDLADAVQSSAEAYRLRLADSTEPEANGNGR